MAKEPQMRFVSEKMIERRKAEGWVAVDGMAPRYGGSIAMVKKPQNKGAKK